MKLFKLALIALAFSIHEPRAMASNPASLKPDFNEDDAVQIDPAADQGAVTPELPEKFNTKGKFAAYVTDVIQSAPPAGGSVSVLHEWNAHYAKNDKVGEIWILPVLVRVTVDGKTGYDQVFVVYHTDSKTGEIQVDFGVDPEKVGEYIKEN